VNFLRRQSDPFGNPITSVRYWATAATGAALLALTIEIIKALG
jgi:hypothetical protein